MRYVEALCWCFVAFFVAADIYSIFTDLSGLWGWSVPSAEAWAAWVQAVGSIGAILVAVWVSHHQHEKQRERERDHEREEVRRMLCCLRGELEAAVASVERNVGKHMLPNPSSTAFNMTYPLGENSFPIFHAFVPKLGLISDPQLREEVIGTYSRAHSLVMTFKYNNELIDDFETKKGASQRSGEVLDKEIASQAWNRLERYGAGLCDSYFEAVDSIEALIDRLPRA